MPGQHPEIWLRRVVKWVAQTITAPWLEGIEEVPGGIIDIGEGTLTETNLVHVPMSMFKPECMIDNQNYPIGIEQYTDDVILLRLEKYQTKATSISDDTAMGAAYPVIESNTKSHVESIMEKKYMKGIWNLCPDADGVDTPIVLTGGDINTVAGVKRLQYEDIVAMKDRLDAIQAPKEGRRLVLCSTHWNDLLLDRDRFADKYLSIADGKVMKVAGFEIYEYAGNPTAETISSASGFAKDPFGSASGNPQVSVVFVASQVVKKTGKTKQYFKRSGDDPEMQANLLNYRHYHMVAPLQKKYIGAICSFKV